MSKEDKFRKIFDETKKTLGLFFETLFSEGINQLITCMEKL